MGGSRRKALSTRQGMQCWNGLLRQVLGSASRTDFKAWLKKATTKLTKHQWQSCFRQAAGLDEMKRSHPTGISVGGWKCLRKIRHMRVLCMLPSCSFLLLCSTYVKQQLPEVIQERLFPQYAFLFLILLLLTSAELHTFAYRNNVTFWQWSHPAICSRLKLFPPIPSWVFPQPLYHQWKDLLCLEWEVLATIHCSVVPSSPTCTRNLVSARRFSLQQNFPNVSWGFLKQKQ